jgi:pimeloyl-ACP methyl ester carboxylesterase
MSSAANQSGRRLRRQQISNTRDFYLSESLRIELEHGVVLAATLHLPFETRAALFPVVLAIPGGGPSGRHSYDLLTERLNKNGIAVLEYDKRGVWQSTGKHTDEFDVQVNDSAAIVDLLRNRPEIDGDRIGVIGLCHGAMVATLLALHEPSIAGIVMLSGPVGPRPSPFLGLVRSSLIGSGMDEPFANEITKLIHALVEARMACASLSVTTDLENLLVSRLLASAFPLSEVDKMMTWLTTAEAISIWNVEPDRNLAMVRCPVLALYASIDPLVPPPVHMPAAKIALSSNPDATITEIASVNHIFQPGVTGTFEEMRDLGAPVQAPQVILTVVEWFVKRLNKNCASTATKI